MDTEVFPFISSLNSFSNVSEFSLYSFFPFRQVNKYFNSLEIVNGIIFLISFSNCLPSLYRNVTMLFVDCVFYYFVEFVYSNFSVESLSKFSTYEIIGWMFS